MKIDRRGRSYATWVVIGGDDSMSFDVSFDNTTWYPAELAGVVTTTTEESGISVTGLQVRVLVRGPDAEEWTGDIVLVVGPNRARLRVTDSPEIVIQNAGTITVV